MTLLDRILDLATLSSGAIPAGARRMARFSLYDWMVCGVAGTTEPLAVRLRQVIGAEGGHPVASILGGAAMPARAAALVNHLQGSEGMAFNGVILVSSILNFLTARFDTGN